uniref:Phytocyanin domain-containing protein n=1 Tax=Brassica campestris TaxID=3711 RepID=M4F0K6_BRACM
MGLSKARKLLLILVITAYLFSGTAHAWSWSWGSGQSGSNWGWGWGSDDNSGSGSGGSNPNSGGGSSWGWGWSSNGTDTNWGWGSSSGSSGTGSTHKSYHNHTTPSTHSNGSGSNKTRGSIGSSHKNHTAQVSSRRKIEVTVWKNGFDYQEWASKHAPFLTNDVLSFKGKKLVARGGSSSGFKLLLRKTHETYFFASGDHNGCNHNMKFSISPIPRSSSHTKP